MLRCPKCSRPNPDGIYYCFHDGQTLGVGAPQAGQFRVPLVFPSGRSCRSFDELAQACLDDWAAALDLLRGGTLATFLAAQGRSDLAAACRRAAAFPDTSSALDELIRSWPTHRLQPARLRLDQTRIELGQLAIGQNSQFRLRLRNEGMGLLRGTIGSDAPWLAVSDDPGTSSRHFAFTDSMLLPLHVHGKALRASTQPLVGHLTVSSSGGDDVIEVVAEVLPVPFTAGTLAGARTPRQLAEKAKANPRDASVLFTSGAVAAWYQRNGWIYPVEGEAAAGLAAVQQYFDALGLTTPPKLTLSETALTLEAPAGSSLTHTLRLSTTEKRPVYARVVSNQPWLTVCDVLLDGSAAKIHLNVPHVPNCTGETLQASLSIHANARQSFDVPVRLRVRAATRPSTPPVDWLPSSVATSPPLRAAPPTWTTTAPTPPPVPQAPTGRDRVVSLTPERGNPSLSRGLIVGVLFGLVGLLTVAITLVALLASRTPEVIEEIAQLPGEVQAQAEAAEESSLQRATAEEAAPEKATIKPPSRVVRPVYGIRRRDEGRDPNEPILLPELESREVEVVFCLDTTGSMGALLSGAKAKIWAICNQVAGGKPTPALRVGLVAFRDKGDAYVTKVTDLSRDLDAIHTELNTFEAAGGGDTPESVNQALDDAVTKISWSKNKRTLKMIFVVGDAPPHMDYDDDVKYPVSCARARDAGIFINTVQCGNDAECRRHWKEMAAKADGEYVTIPQTGGVVTVATPHDAAMIELGRKLFDTALIHGSRSEKKAGERALRSASRLFGPVGADRVAFAAKSKRVLPFDLIDTMRSRKLELADFKDAELPDRMKRMSRAEQRQFVERVVRQRKELFEKILELENKRAAALFADPTKGSGKGFDGEVLSILRKQAKMFDISY